MASSAPGHDEKVASCWPSCMLRHCWMASRSRRSGVSSVDVILPWRMPGNSSMPRPIHMAIALLSYTRPLHAVTGSTIRSHVIGQTNAAGTVPQAACTRSSMAAATAARVDEGVDCRCAAASSSSIEEALSRLGLPAAAAAAAAEAGAAASAALWTSACPAETRGQNTVSQKAENKGHMGQERGGWEQKACVPGRQLRGPLRVRAAAPLTVARRAERLPSRQRRSLQDALDGGQQRLRTRARISNTQRGPAPPPPPHLASPSSLL
jgi:hypothetical protein